MATKVAALYAVKLIPIAGDFLSEVLADIDKYLEKGKEIEAEAEELKKSLAEWADKLEEVKRGHTSASIQALEEAIREFKAFVDDWKPPRGLKKIQGAFKSLTEHDAFTNTYHAFEKKLDNLKLVIMVEILQTIVKNHEELRQKVGEVDQHLTENHEETIRQGNKHHGELTRAVASVRNAIGWSETKGHIKVPMEWRDALYAYKGWTTS